MGGIVTQPAPAKINLYLHIVGRRPDGYHELESLFVFTQSGDEIRVQPSDTLTLKISGPFAAALTAENYVPEDNLVLRAARALALAGSSGQGADIELVKNLPIASGIGGGSADAAATLLALNKLWGLNLSLHALSEIALTLGADVPACLHRVPLFVSGIGETLDPVKLEGSHTILLVNPSISLSTPTVFKAFHTGASSGFLPKIGYHRPRGPGLGLWLSQHTSNSLQASAVSLCPQIAEVLARLEACDGARLVRMSGSGATCFALFDDPVRAEKAKHTVKTERPDWWVFKDHMQIS